MSDDETIVLALLTLIPSVGGLAAAWHIGFGLGYIPAGVIIAVPAALATWSAGASLLTGSKASGDTAAEIVKDMLLLIPLVCFVLFLPFIGGAEHASLVVILVTSLLLRAGSEI